MVLKLPEKKWARTVFEKQEKQYVGFLNLQVSTPGDWPSRLHKKKSTLFQPAITCSKLAIETLEQGVKYKVNDVVLVYLILNLNMSRTFF